MPKIGFGMKVACRSLRMRHVLHDEAERADVVGGRQHVVVAEVDLVLAGRDLVMRGLDVEAHLLEREDDLAAHVLAEIDRRQVEVAAGVVRLGRRLAVAPLEQEELGLGAGVHREAPLGGERDDALQRACAGSPSNGVAVRVGDVADHPADPLAATGCPTGRPGRSSRSGRRYMSDSSIRTKPSIDEPSNMIWPSSASLELAVGDLDVLDRPEDVGELQAHELHLLALGALEDARLPFREVRRARLAAMTAPSSHRPSRVARPAPAVRPRVSRATPAIDPVHAVHDATGRQVAA